jgi:hypothetical protein
LSKSPDLSSRLLPRIRRELDKLPLSDEQKARIIPRILENARFLDTRAGRTTAGGLIEDSDLFAFDQKLHALLERFADDGLTAETYLKAASECPRLLYQSPDALIMKITAVVDRFAADGLTSRDYLKAMLMQPTLSGSDPVTVAKNIQGVVDHFAADGLTTRDYLRSAVRQPSLFYADPATVDDHIRGVVDRFAAEGLTTADYLTAARKHPGLFLQAARTICHHIETILSMHDDGVFKLPGRGDHPRLGDGHGRVISFLLKNPGILSFEDNNLTLRSMHQAMTSAEPNSTILRRTRRQTESELLHHLGHPDPSRSVPRERFLAGQEAPTDQQARHLVLRALIHAGCIKGVRMER